MMSRGFDRQYGARQLRRAVERWLENPMAEEILRGQIPDGEIIEVEAGKDKLIFRPPTGGGDPPPPAKKAKTAKAPAAKTAKAPAKKATRPKKKSTPSKKKAPPRS
jgi:hypothetical protein